MNPDFRRLCWATDGWKYSLKHKTRVLTWLSNVMESHKKKGDRKTLHGIYISLGGGKARRKKTKINWDREESKRKYKSRESARNGSQRSIWVAVTLITHSSTYFTLLLTHQANEPSTKQGIIFDNQRSLVKRVKQSSLLKEFKLEHNGLRTQEWKKICLWIGSIV